MLPRPARVRHAQSLLEPEIHAHLAVHRARGAQILARVLGLPDASLELRQTQAAVSDQRAHAMPLGEYQRLPVVSSAAFGIELVWMGCRVAEKPERMGREARLSLSGFQRSTAEAARFVDPAEQEAGAAQCAV